MTNRHLKNNTKRNIIIAIVAIVVIFIGGIAFGAYKMNDQVTSNQESSKTKKTKVYDGSDDHNTKSKKTKKSEPTTTADTSVTQAPTNKATTNNSSTNTKTNSAPAAQKTSTQTTPTTGNAKTTTAPATAKTSTPSQTGITMQPNLTGATTVLNTASAQQLVAGMGEPTNGVTQNTAGSYTVKSGNNEFTIIQQVNTAAVYYLQPDANGNMQVVATDIVPLH